MKAPKYRPDAMHFRPQERVIVGTRVAVATHKDKSGGVFSEVRGPGSERIKVMNRDVYEKAMKKAGAALEKVNKTRLKDRTTVPEALSADLPNIKIRF